MKAPSLLHTLMCSILGIATLVVCVLRSHAQGSALPHNLAHAAGSGMPLHGFACLAFAAVALVALASAAVVYGPQAEILEEQGIAADSRIRMVARGDAPVEIDPDSQAIRALVVGAGSIGRTLAANLESSGRYHVVGFVDDHLDLPGRDKGDILGGREAVSAIVQQYGIEEIFIAYAPSWQQRLAERLSLEYPDVGVRVVPTAYESMMRLAAVESYGDIAVVRLTAGIKRAQEAGKRLFDILVAAVGLTLLFPISFITAVLIKLTSRGPVLFTQERTGRFGKPFRMYKFRTMSHNAEAATGPVLSSGKSDPRLTSLGKWLRMVRVDEIPQLWNVLCGHMSMVGPRPERPCFTEQYDKTIPAYSRRHTVRPGITGLAQICGGYHTDARDKLRFDLIYISHQSVWLDITLLVRTILVVVLPHKQKFDRNDSTNR
ncbi:MAG TPA: sugar transferase [Capsulimonadaceae bacterium]|nr:sugar transferase [Capsulimonadaceae bacterium]